MPDEMDGVVAWEAMVSPCSTRRSAPAPAFLVVNLNWEPDGPRPKNSAAPARARGGPRCHHESQPTGTRRGFTYFRKYNSGAAEWQCVPRLPEPPPAARRAASAPDMPPPGMGGACCAHWKSAASPLKVWARVFAWTPARELFRQPA